MVDAIISTAVGKANAIISNEVNLLRGVKDEVSDLSKKLGMIKDVLDDAEKRGVKEASVKNWLKKLEDTAYEMDDILDEWSYSLLKHKKVPQNLLFVMALPNWLFMFISNIRRCIPTSCLCFEKFVDRHDTAMKVKNVKLKLDQILKEKNDFKFEITESATDQSWRAQSISSIDFKKVYGQDINNKKKDLVRRLMLNDDSQILCIVGMGGLGKTTLAKLVYNDPQVVKGCFELRIWICVSDPFDVATIARVIIHSVTKESGPSNTYQLELVMESLRDCISGKKFLLVLDDVWTDKNEEWEPLKINLKGAAGSKILVTTRKESVANMMCTLDKDICRPKRLNHEECWSLLRCVSLLGKSEEECGEFEDVGKEIARKCNGLPLAANLLGSHLQLKHRLHRLKEWKKVLGSEIWQLEEKKEVEIFRHLVLSYNELSPTLKHCFSYLAIYPKDSDIYPVDVIEEWMALGYLGSVVGNERVELDGRDYFDNLAMRSLLQDFNFEKIGEQIESWKMHDIVHDFAQFLRKNNDAKMKKPSCEVCESCLVYEAQEYRTLFWNKEIPLVVCDCLTSLRVLRFISEGEGLPQRMEQLIHLRLLDLRNTELSKEDLKVICMLYLLQTLLLVGCTLKEIPEEFGNLYGLRKLDLSNNAITKLPESIYSLLELQTLLLIECSLEVIGEEIGNMVGLRHLDLSWNRELTELPESICGLRELQFLALTYCHHLNGLPERIHMLQKLQQLLIVGTPIMNRMPKGIGQLSGLHTLKLESFKVGSGLNKLGLLKNLNYLTGDLELEIELSSISDLEELVEDARDAQLRKKIHFQSLSIDFHSEMEWSSSSSASLWMNVIEALEPNQKLKDLLIKGYGGCRLPHWISSPLNLVKEITLFDCSKVSSLPHMGKLPLLESLMMVGLDELKVVGREFLGIESSSTQHVVAFPKLKHLMFQSLKKWEEWEDITVEEEESTAVSVMPCLTHFTIDACEGLKKLPHRLLRKASSLQFLDIDVSGELKKSYGDKDGSAWRSISQYNPQLQLHLHLLPRPQLVQMQRQVRFKLRGIHSQLAFPDFRWS